MAIDHSHTALIMVDSQAGALDNPYWGTARSNPAYEANVIKLLKAFRSLQGEDGPRIVHGPAGPHIVHVYHRSLNPASPLHSSSSGMAFHDISHPAAHETVFPKTTNSAFQGSDLGEYLRAKKCWKIYFAGLSVDHCLGTTVRHASDLDVGKHVDARGENVPGQLMLIGDATAAWAKHGGKYDAETVHGVHLESLKGEFCRVLTTEEVLKELGIHEGEVLEM